jgi:hypothetical protein
MSLTGQGDRFARERAKFQGQRRQTTESDAGQTQLGVAPEE